ncbi:MAG TPA: PEP-CTERM sorting domain-containing protein [Fimbriimonadaceae bacterium]|nr:PEP-CTERM sorting domain-containing protein [Fimbriimonadaceae bacterium]
MNHKSLIPLVALGAVALAPTANAAITLNFSDVVTGSPVGGPVYATLTIENAGTNTVNFTMTNTTDPNVAGGQFISRLMLNVDPFVSGLDMSWTSPEIKDFQFKQDGVNDAGAMFDYGVYFVTANNGDRFTAGKTVTWSATGDGLTEDNFIGQLSKGNASYESMVQLQAIPPNGGSAKVTPGDPVPEPASLFALGLGATALLRRRRQ